MKFSLRKKTIIFIILMALAFGTVSVVASRKVITDLINDEYTSRTTELANTVATVLDPDEVQRLRDAVMEIYSSIDEADRYNSEHWGEPEFDAYLANFEPIREMPEFTHIMSQLRDIQDKNSVDCLYLNYMDTVSVAAIYLLDAAVEDACPPGCFDQYDMENAANQAAFSNPEIGYPAYITNTEAYGWLVSTAVPIFDKNGNVICYSCVDISMNEIRARQRELTNIILLILILLAAVVCVLGYFVVNRVLVRPINTLSETAANYIKEEDIQGRHGFADLKIKSSDEIGSLAESMKQMESDINDYYKNLLAAREEVSRMGEMANRDALTGIRNKRAYDDMLKKIDGEIAEGNAVFGIGVADLNCLKMVNDTYGHDMGNIAIKKLCRLICVTFSHSPVFRIGGDEFAIILKNSDFDQVEELVAHFEAEISNCASDDSLEPWEKTSAALGYSIFRPDGDKCADDVFRRADTLMYERKKEMKQQMK